MFEEYIQIFAYMLKQTYHNLRLDRRWETVADPGFLEGGFCHTIASKACAKSLEATSTVA